VDVSKDLKAAGIPFFDGQGRRADFHSLRGTFNMLMALRNVDPQTRKLAMRHSDIKLTANTYMDGTLLPLNAAIHALPWLGESAPDCAPATDSVCPVSSSSVTNVSAQRPLENLISALDEHDNARNGTTGLNVENGCLARIRT
jgi:hypothetical protein